MSDAGTGTSKAGAWAQREIKRCEALEEAKARIEAELDAPSPDKAPVFIHRSNIFANVAAFNPGGTLVFRTVAHNPSMDTAEALAFARWILDMFEVPR